MANAIDFFIFCLLLFLFFKKPTAYFDEAQHKSR